MIPKFILGNGVSNYFGTSENKYENRKICRFCLVKIVGNYSKGPLLSQTIFGSSEPFKNNDKCFLFHVNISFRS